MCRRLPRPEGGCITSTVHAPEPVPPEPKRPYARLIVALAAAFLLALAIEFLATGFYATWAVSSSQHKWCSTVDLLNKAPAPPAGKSATQAPAQAYDRELASDFRMLKDRLGC